MLPPVNMLPHATPVGDTAVGNPELIALDVTAVSDQFNTFVGDDAITGVDNSNSFFKPSVGIWFGHNAAAGAVSSFPYVFGHSHKLACHAVPNPSAYM